MDGQGAPLADLEELDRRLHELSVRYELACTLTHPRPVEDVLEDFLGRLARAVNAEIAIAFAEGPEDEPWRVRRAVGLGRRQLETTRLAPALRPRTGPSEPATPLDAEALARVAPAYGGRLRSGAAAPLHTGDSCLGVLLLARLDGRPFSRAHLGLVGEMAGRLALRVDHARLFSELANAHLSTAVTQTGDAVEITDLDGTLEYVNPAWERLFGYSREEVAGLSVDALLRVGEGPVRAGVAGGTVWTGRLCGRRRDGAALELDVTISPARDAAGELSHIVTVRRDRTESIRAAAALRESEERYALAARGANDGLWDWRLSTGEVYYSERWKQILGHGADEVGQSVDEWLRRVHPEERECVDGALKAHLSGELPHFEVEHRMRHRDGRWLWVLTRGLAFRDERGRVTRMAGSQTDISSRKGVERQLAYLATHDGLTSLPNRQLFTERLQACVERRRADASAGYAILFVDLDRFKNVNDGLGHLVGDRLLLAVADRLRRCLRAGDLAARLGGDEFGVLLPDVADEAAALQVSERILCALTRPVHVDGHEIYTGSSIGVALGHGGYASAAEVLRDADTAMYTAKSGGRGRCEVFDAGMHERAAALQRMEADLHRARGAGEFLFEFQPIVGLPVGALSGFEALLRWRHPTRGIVSPAEFIPVAEETGLIHAIWREMLPVACAEAQRWQARLPGAYVSVNVSPAQFSEADLVDTVRAALASTGLPAACLTLELTETALTRDADRAAEAIQAFRAMGIRIALDDFGTGYSSLSMLRRFHFNTLKIDRSFIEPLEQRPAEAEVVRAIIALAASVGVDDVVAEGVETGGQARLLAAFGCRSAQGYHFARPLEAAAIPSYVAQARSVAHEACPASGRRGPHRVEERDLPRGCSKVA